MRTLIHDVRYAIRLLVRHRGVTVVALITLSLAIGANAAIFSVYNALLFARCHFPSRSRWRRWRAVLRGQGRRDFRAQVLPVAERRGDGLHGHRGLRHHRIGLQPDRQRRARSAAGHSRVGRLPQNSGRCADARPRLPAGRGRARRAQASSSSATACGCASSARAPISSDAQIALNDEPFTVDGRDAGRLHLPGPADLWTLFQFDPASRIKRELLQCRRAAAARRLVRAGPRSDLDVVLAATRRRTIPNAVDDRETCVRPAPARSA